MKIFFYKKKREVKYFFNILFFEKLYSQKRLQSKTCLLVYLLSKNKRIKIHE